MDRKIHLKNLKLQPPSVQNITFVTPLYTDLHVRVHLLKTNTDQISAYEFKCLHVHSYK